MTHGLSAGAAADGDAKRGPLALLPPHAALHLQPADIYIQLVSMQVRLLMEMLNADPWRYFPLTLHFTSSQHVALGAGCLPLPAHMSTSVGPLLVSNWLLVCILC